MRIAFVGIGVMGGPMAAHLAKAGHELRVYNRSPEKARAWAERYAGQACTSLPELVEDAQALISCVGRDEDLRAICLGAEGVYQWLPAGAIHIDHTTASASVARELDQAARQRGLEFVDAPVSGGQAGAENGQLTIMAGGSEGACERAQSLVQAYARHFGRIGDAGAGQLAKMVNQICVGGVLQGLSEALRFGEASGLDMARVLEAIEQGAAGSWQMSHRAGTMLKREFDFGFAIDWMLKDLGIVLDEAAQRQLSLPLTAELVERYRRISEAGGGRWDTSALINQWDVAEPPKVPGPSRS